MSRLVLINGAPGAGKSTLAQALAQDRPMTLALDIDAIKHSLGCWSDDPASSGTHARRLALTLAHEHLTTGHDVVIGQYLARTPFIDDLAALASSVEAEFREVVIDMTEDALRERLSHRTAGPTRPEHQVNNRLVGPDDAAQLIASLRPLRLARPHSVWVDGTGSIESTLDLLRRLLQ